MSRPPLHIAITHQPKTPPMKTREPDSATEPSDDVDDILMLAAIIREVDGAHRLGAAALAEAILSHPASRWGHQPAPPPPAPPPTPPTPRTGGIAQ